MEKLYFLFFLTIGFLSNAQIVNIPDVNLKTYLTTNGSSFASSGTPVSNSDPQLYEITVPFYNYIDTNADDEIQVSEAQNVKYLKISNLNDLSSLEGLEGKLFEAMQLGLPSITTKVGAEAMNGNLDWNGFISENENDFVEKAIELYTNKSLWETAQKNGYEIIEKRFKKELYETDFMNRIEELQQNLKTNRNQNFLGQILQHQSLQSTKYMSKWIEAKNS
ncbi:glycosyltransferase [Flavobacterium sp.]|uniref:glycosyltransferase n=1 Tax=Flavobacterium sp. TaxID=239 RepID=UPI0040489AE1